MLFLHKISINRVCSILSYFSKYSARCSSISKGILANTRPPIPINQHVFLQNRTGNHFCLTSLSIVSALTNSQPSLSLYRDTLDKYHRNLAFFLLFLSNYVHNHCGAAGASQTGWWSPIFYFYNTSYFSSS